MNHAPLAFDAALRLPNVRFFLGSVGCFTLASRALVVVIGFQIYQITHSALALGWLGLVEAIPVLSLVLFGGYVADHYNRQRILIITRSASVLCALGLALISQQEHATPLLGLYGIIFLAGIARGFADPANSAFESQIVPKNLTVNASSWIGSTWIGCSIVGPALIGFVFAAWGAFGSYLIITALFTLSLVFTLLIKSPEQIMPKHQEPLLTSIQSGWRFVWSQQPLWGAMILDLFAVLFGGMMALLPIYANDILHVGPQGLGLLNAAPSIGALLMMLYATKHPPIHHAGRNLLLVVTGFGLSVLVFAFSTHFWISMLALIATGVFDGVSMVIRRSMIRLLSPEGMRGRISSVSWVFVCASNELGAFESGMLAALIGTVPCVAVGGVMTLVVVGLVSVIAPQLKHLRFNPHTLERL